MSQKNKAKPSSSSTADFKGWLWVLGVIAFIIFAITTSTEDYSAGDRIGFITKFSHKGRYWKSWEGELNLTQTGMNTSSLFDFSIDNDDESAYLVTMIDSAVNNGWKVKLSYHQTSFKNWLSNRGETNYFVNSIQILDRTTLGNNSNGTPAVTGKVIDTIYVVIDKSELLKNKSLNTK